MRKTIATILPLLILSATSFAQEPTEPLEPAPVAAEEEVSAADDAEPYRIIVNFEPNSLELTPLSSARLDSMSAVFARNTRHRYEVHGYSCPIEPGSQGKVIRLSTQRVELMVDHLLSLGVPGENIVTVVNAPKSGVAAKGCTEDRQVDIVSSGTRWREYQQPAAPPEPAPVPILDPNLNLIDDLKTTVMDPLKQKLAEAEEPPEELPKVKPIMPESGKQVVAVYMAGQEPQGAKGVHTIIGGELAKVMSESDKYTAVDRTEAILEQLDREHVYQRSGAVDDDQIKAIGHQLGVEYLCISNINPVGKRYYLDTRLVDVVTAEIKRSVTATSTLKDADEMTRVGRDIALELLEAEKTRRQRALRKKIFRYTAIGLDVLGAGALAYGYMENSNVVENTKRIDEVGRGHIKNGPEADRAVTRRNVAYIVGGALVAAGVTIHIVF